MTNLIKADFKRVLKDKLLLVVGILALAFAFVTPLLYRVLVGEMSNDPTLEAMGFNAIYAKTQFFSSFSLGNNVGLVIPVFISIILCKDFSHGTVRNKIIGGKSRTSVFFSMYIVCAAITWAVILVHAFLTLGISLMFFDYQATEFTASDIAYFFESLAIQFMVYLFVAALITFLCTAMKNVGLVIVLYVAVMFGFTMIAGIVQIAVALISMDGGNTFLKDVLTFFQKINVFNYSTMVGMGTSYELKDILCYFLSPVVGTAGLLGFGTLIFNKKDLK